MGFSSSFVGFRLPIRIEDKHIVQHTNKFSEPQDIKNQITSSIFHPRDNESEREKPFQCHTCFKTFKHKRRLNAHNTTHLGIKFECEVCHRKLSTKNHLRLHMRTHTNERPAVCSYCGKGFRRGDALTEHIRIHTGQRPYVCEVCGKGFTQKQALNTHKRGHTGEIPYHCEFCSERFSTKALVRHHVRSHHSTARLGISLLDHELSMITSK
ncbi:hypothetical protein WDU94_004337 [Cyamophila willieti]